MSDVKIPISYPEIIQSYKELLEKYQAAQTEIIRLKQQLSELKRLIYGQKRERFIPSSHPKQIEMELGLKDTFVPVPEEVKQISYNRTKVVKRCTPHGRKELPSHLPRRDVIIEPSEDTEGLVKIGEEITEELEYEPGNLYVKRYIRPKYAKKNGDGVLIGSLPSRPIEKGIPGPGLLSHIMISKYVDHLPLYRQQQQFRRHGVEISESTLNNWVKCTYELLLPLYELYRKRILSQDYIMVDETYIKVLDRNKKGKTHQGYFWSYYDPLGKEVYFDYRKSRSRAGPEEMLNGFHGYLQTDGYTVYDEISHDKGITLLNCMAHARRYYDKSLLNDRKRSEWMLKKIQDLYQIERACSNLTFEERYTVRKEKSLPILNEMKTWLDETSRVVLPKSSIGKAVMYMLSHWTGLTRYLEQGRFNIDNNPLENIIRPIALGRKNYLFAGSHEGAKRSALIYTLVSNAKLQDKEPLHI